MEEEEEEEEDEEVEHLLPPHRLSQPTPVPHYVDLGYDLNNDLMNLFRPKFNLVLT